MAYSNDLRWRAVSLMFCYNLTAMQVSDILDISARSVARWYRNFERHGEIDKKKKKKKTKRRVPDDVIDFIKQYVEEFPCFYIDEIRKSVCNKFPKLHIVLKSQTLLRILKEDLHLSRKIIEKRAMEAVPQEIDNYIKKMSAIYVNPSQLVFIDETSKDGRSAYRRRGWAPRGKKCVNKIKFGRGKRISLLAAADSTGFIAHAITEGTFTRQYFHSNFCKKILPLLNPYPWPRSIVVMDNARIHMYQELQDVIHEKGALLIFLPPYCPHLNPIEVYFGLLKKWIQKECNLTFHLYPESIIEIALYYCVVDNSKGINIFHHCGYESTNINDKVNKD